MSSTKSDTLHVPGANLYYRVRGSGPLLLILQGGDGDAEAADSMVEHLVDYYTVVTYDRRGLSHSTIDEHVEMLRLETHADDAHHLLAALTTEPAFVLGNSIGALIGLDLVARYPEQVCILVAHEAPAMGLLSDTERTHAMQARKEVAEISRLDGVLAGMRKNFANIGINMDDREPDVVLAQPGPQRAANLEFFQTYDVPAVGRYRLNIDALKAAAIRIIPAGGRTSQDAWPHHSAEALAELLGRPFVEFPGGHNGFVLHPRAFAARLREVLGDGSL